MKSIIRKIQRIYNLQELDKNEIEFSRNSIPYNNHLSSDKKSHVVFQMPMDYFYVGLFSIIGNELSQQESMTKTGLWPLQIVEWGDKEEGSIIRIVIRYFVKKITVRNLKMKWCRIYSGGGFKENIDINKINIFVKIFNSFKAYWIWKSIKSKKELLELVIDDIHCGDLIYDTYIRFRVKPTVDLDDLYLYYTIKKCIDTQYEMKHLLKIHNVDTFFSSFSSYIQHGIPVREALKAGVTVYTAGTLSQYFKRLSIDNTCHLPNYPEYAVNFSLLNDKEIKLIEAKNKIEKRFSGHIDSATKYMKTSAYLTKNSKMPDGVDGVVFLHDFFDNQHSYRWVLFEDFWEWCIYTLGVIQEYKLNFVVKPHPNQIKESEDVIIKLKKMFPDIVWLDSSVSNSAIMNSGIHCGVSVYGTILHELAYHNIVPIAAGDHPHISFDFVNTPETKKEYKYYLLNFKNLELPEDYKETVLAFYYMHNIYYKEDLNTIAPSLNLRNIKSDSSECLIEYLNLLDGMKA